ncbi:MAG TPA: hypothetical protein VMV18_09505 [bacterium]|nr:hypothetical protein [bacterium]
MNGLSAKVEGEGAVLSHELPGGVEGQVLAGDFKAFANPTEIGFEAHGALAQAKKTLGPCDITAGVGVVNADARLGIGHSGDLGGADELKQDKNGKYHRSNGQFASKDDISSFKHDERNKAFNKATGGMIDCSASVSANLVEVGAECKTAVGTFKPTVDGVGAKGECDCTGCEASAYLVWGSMDYDSPSIGGCGLKASFHGSLEGGVGVKAAAGGAKKGVGARLALGPVGFSAGVSVDEFDPGAMADCAGKALKAVGTFAVDAGKKVGDLAVSTFNNVKDGLGSVVNGAGNLLGSAAHSLCFWCSDDKPKAPTGPATNTSSGEPAGSNVARTAMTTPGSAGVQGGAIGSSSKGAGVPH